MRHRIFLVVLLSIISAQLSIAETFSVLVDTPVLRVRQQPKGKIIGRVYLGQQFIVRAEKKGWGQVKFQHERYGWISLDYTKPLPLHSKKLNLASFCKKLNLEFEKLQWKTIGCESQDWEAQMESVQGNPLIYTVIGNQAATSLLLCSVHSDENTTYQCFRLLQLLKQQPQLLNYRLVIAPLVNPDGFLKKYKTRTNARGADLNRNLPTKNWARLALKRWKQRYRGAKRRYPGHQANSEPENQFVIWLIQRFHPDKILSIHAPLNFLDLDYMDGNNRTASQRHIFKKATALALDFSKTSQYKFRDYRTFVGSLGRWGGEWKIPIYTLELPSSDYTKSEFYFQKMQQSLFHAFNQILDHRRTAQIFSASKQVKVN